MLQEIYFLTLPLVCLCSEVLDEFSQKKVIVSDYCPSLKGCQDGTHVMCLHYDPNKAMGPECVDAINPSLTPDFAQLILDICNRIRSKVANGLGKGEDGSALARGYGMLKLSWDPELATLAQVWANQCILKIDFCRSTKRFPNAGQIIGMSRYTITDWMPVSMTMTNMFNSTTLTPDKIRYAITSILKAWYEMKDDVTTDMINYLDVVSDLKHNQFLQLVSGRSTHMGCGLTAYKEYSFSDNNAALNFNSIQIVCNFSYRPRIGESVYTTKPPTKPGYTLRCGCPLGFDEDEDCLCYETNREMPYTCKDFGRCKPSVVVLPIFTVEDAPLNMVRQNNSRTTETSLLRHEVIKRVPFTDYTRSNKNNLQIIKQDSLYRTRRIITDVKNRYFGAKSTQTNKLKTKAPHGENIHKNIRKQSIFAKSPIFELPSSKTKQIVRKANYKKDVIPRKDFSKVQKLVSKYLEGHRIGHSLQKTKNDLNVTRVSSATVGPYNKYNKVNKNVHNLNRFTKHKFTYMDLNSTRTSSPKDEIKPLYEESDQIFMNLLDKLEEEVNNIDFNTKEKEIFDEKIRKIYGTLVKKSVVTEHSILRQNISLNKDMVDNNDIQNNLNRRNYWSNLNKPDEYNYPNLEERTINEKSMKKYYNKIDRDIGDNKYGKEYSQLSYGSESLYNQNMEERELRNMHAKKKSHFNSIPKGNFRHDNYYLKRELEEYSSLESSRRKHYNDKLNNLQRKISIMKKNGRQNFVTEDRHLRPVRPSKHGGRRSRPKEMDLYMPDRARFVHGF